MMTTMTIIIIIIMVGHTVLRTRRRRRSGEGGPRCGWKEEEEGEREGQGEEEGDKEVSSKGTFRHLPPMDDRITMITKLFKRDIHFTVFRINETLGGRQRHQIPFSWEIQSFV